MIRPVFLHMTRLLRLVVAFLAIYGVSAEARQSPEYLVERVIDGDTIVLAGLGTVRLIGVDTPEAVDPRTPVQRYALESAAFLRGMVQGRTVRVEYDQRRTDRYRRTLAYLFLDDGAFVNLEIVRQGYGHAYVEYPFAHIDRFRAAEREAREAGRGLWADDQTAAPAKAVSGPARVWVNSSSKVYHCPGTRYYGTTARGEYMLESAAREKGHRPAYGRTCGPLSDSTSAVADVQPRKGVGARAALNAPSPPAIKVWVNTASGVYHCPGTRYYGTTKKGAYMSQPEAQKAGHRPAAGRTCS